MDNIYTDVIIYKGKVGKLVKYIENKEEIYRFYPAGHGGYYKEELEIVKNPEIDVSIADEANGKEYAIYEFRKFHKDSKYISINERYQIIVDNKGKYHPHIKYKSTSRVFNDLKSALLGMIIYDSVGTDDLHLNKYIFKLLDMEW